MNNATPFPPEERRRSLARRMIKFLKEKELRIAFAESCTGGLCAAEVVAIPDASAVLDASVVTYSNEMKTALVGVLPETLAAYGAVSEEVAGEMAVGIARVTGADIGIGVSGIAGPTGGTPEKPVGTVAFGFSVCGRLHTETRHFEDLDRNGVRDAAVRHVYATVGELVTML